MEIAKRLQRSSDDENDAVWTGTSKYVEAHCVVWLIGATHRMRRIRGELAADDSRLTARVRWLFSRAPRMQRPAPSSPVGGIVNKPLVNKTKRCL